MHRAELKMRFTAKLKALFTALCKALQPLGWLICVLDDPRLRQQLLFQQLNY